MDSCHSRFHLQIVTHAIRPVPFVAGTLVDVLEAGADSVQLRDDQATPAQGRMLVEAISRDLPGAVDCLIVHERLFAPMMLPGVMRHLPIASVRAAVTLENRARIVDGLPFGVSVHTIDEARWASAFGAAYLTFGHVFESPSHPRLPPRGVAALSRIVTDMDVPVLAIGGITPDTLEEVLATGCSGIVVRSAVLGQRDPVAATRRLRALLDDSPYQPCRRFARPNIIQGEARCISP